MPGNACVARTSCLLARSTYQLLLLTLILPEDLNAHQSCKHDNRHRQGDEDPLQGGVHVSSQQAVGGEAAAGHCGKGKLSSIEDPMDRLGCWYVDSTQQGGVLQPQI